MHVKTLVSAGGQIAFSFVLKMSPIVIKLQECGVKLQEYGLKMQEYGVKLQEYGVKLQEYGLKLQESGWKLQESGWKLQESGWKLQECGCANAESIEQWKSTIFALVILILIGWERLWTFFACCHHNFLVLLV